MLRSQPYTTALEKRSLGKRAYKSLIETSCSNRISGGYCGGVPPLPIPNREVKPTSADGTAMQCGRVGNRLLLKRVLRRKSWDSFFYAFFFKGRQSSFLNCRTLRGSPDKSRGKLFDSTENLYLCAMNNQGLLALAQLILPSEILTNFEVVHVEEEASLIRIYLDESVKAEYK